MPFKQALKMREKRKTAQVSSINTKRLRIWHTRNFQDACTYLLWTQSHSPLFSRLCRNVTREVASYLSLCGLLPGVYDGRLFVVNAYSETFREVPLAKLSWYRTLLVDDSTAICIAWAKPSYTLYWLDMLTLDIRKLPTLTTTTSSYELQCCFLSQTVYAFFSYSPDSQEYPVKDKQWQSLPNLEINEIIDLLVPHISSIYLFLYSNTLQIFNTLTGELGNEIDFPTDFELNYNSPWVKSAEGKVLCLGKENILWIWDWETNTSMKVLETQAVEIHPNTQGVTLLLGRKMYWLWSGSRQIQRFHTKRIERRGKLLLEEYLGYH